MMSLHESKKISRGWREISSSTYAAKKKAVGKEKNKNLMSHKKKEEKANKRREKMWNMCVKRGTWNPFWHSKIIPLPFVNHFKQIFWSDRQMMGIKRVREEITNWISIIFLFSRAFPKFLCWLCLVLTPLCFTEVH